MNLHEPIENSYMSTRGSIPLQTNPLPMTDHETGQAEWDAYVRQAKGAQYSHLWEWGETLSGTYGLPLFRLTVRRGKNGPLAGILPLILFSPPAGERRLISLPYTDAAGIVADDRQAAADLLSTALEWRKETQARHLELRQAGEALALPAKVADVTSASHSFKTGLGRELPKSEEELWRDLGAKVRNQVRKSQREQCAATIGGVELVEEFFSVFAENMRDLGSPVHDRKLFRTMVERLSGAIVLVRCLGLPVAAAMVFRHVGVLSNPWASSLRRFRPLCPNMLLYWSMLAYGIRCGCHRFDFGRSTPDSPACRFKEQWGAVRQPLTWQIISGTGCHWHPQNESLIDEEWKTLDLETSRRKGPVIRCWISL
jgi:FemAB-related protein (PEP-CTERM system-associated)